MTVGEGRPVGIGRAALLYVAPWVHGYRREWMAPDALAALTLLAIAVPEQLATSRLAVMPPVTGMYAFVAGGICFALLGSNRWLSVGADSTIAPLFAVGVAGLAPSGSARYTELVTILAVVVGILVVAVGALRLGWVAEFLSVPIITGFLAGVAVIIVIHQLPDLLGIPVPGGSSVHRVGYIASHLDRAGGWSVGVGVGVLALLLGAEAVDRRLPAALLGLIGSAVLVTLVGPARGVRVMGTVAPQPPQLGLSGLSLSAVVHLVPLAAVVALVVITQSAATSRGFSDGSPSAALNRDFVGVGAGSVLAGLIGSFPVDASPPRTAAVAAAGGRSQAVSLGSAVVMAALIPAAGLLRFVPLATLSAVLIFIAIRLFHARDLLNIGRFSHFEFVLAALTMLTVAFVGVEQGIGVAVGLAILDRARLDARPQLHVLGRVPGTTSFAPLSSGENAIQVPGVLVVLFATPLWYANAQHFRAEMEQALDRAVGPPRAVVLDAIGMSDVDYTGAGALEEVLDMLNRRGVAFAVARAGTRARAGLDRAGLAVRVGEQRFFGTVGEAVDSFTGPSAPRPTPSIPDPLRPRRSGRSV